MEHPVLETASDVSYDPADLEEGPVYVAATLNLDEIGCTRHILSLTRVKAQ